MEAFSVSNCFPCLGTRRKQVPPTPSPHADMQSDHHHVAATARTFSFEELAAATGNFSDNCRVAAKETALYKGYLKSVNQVVFMKLQHFIDRSELEFHGPTEQQRNNEFLAPVLMLSPLRHPNLLNLIGFCADGSHRIFVHEYLPLGSLKYHLHDPSPDKARLDWSTRMNIAAGVARGLEYLHGKGVVYRAQPLLNKRKFCRMADPALQGRYPSMGLEEALTVASMCIHRDSAMRLPIGDVVTALSRLAYYRPS